MDASSVPLKQCSRKDQCINPLGSWLPATLDYFRKDERLKSKLRSNCLECERRYREDNAEQMREYQRRYYKERREAILLRTRQNYFNRRTQYNEYQRQYYQSHKQEKAEWGRRYRASHADKIRKRHKIYRATHRDTDRRRARSASAIGTHTVADIAVLLRSQKLQCWWCGEKLGKVYHIDHRVPLSRGGTDAPENLCITCPTCNLSKNNKLPQEWSDRLL